MMKKMYKLNHLNTNKAQDLNIKNELALEALNTNFAYENLEKDIKKILSFSDINTFSFSKEGFLGLFLELNYDIAVSLGESGVVIEAALLYEKLGFNVSFISIKKDGEVDYEAIKNLKCSYLFISPYIIDTFVKIDLKKVRKNFSEKIISNISATFEKSISDIVYFDAYKISGYFTHSQILHNDVLKKQNLAIVDSISLKLLYEALKEEKEIINLKDVFINSLEKHLNDDFFFFVNKDITLDNTLHFGLKNIKARQIIRTLSLSNIFITNGEGCSLGLKKPSRILQVMGYSELESRQAICLSFNENLTSDEIEKIAKKIAKAYRQIKALNE